MVAAGCGSYGDGRQQQEDSRGFSYLVALHLLHTPRPHPRNSTTQTAPTAALLCKMVTTEVATSPKCHCCFLERLGCAEAVLLLGEGGASVSPGAPQLGFMWTLNPAGRACGSFPQKPLPQAPWNEFFSQPGLPLFAGRGGVVD